MRKFCNLLVAVLLFALTLTAGTGIDAHFSAGNEAAYGEYVGDPIHI